MLALLMSYYRQLETSLPESFPYEEEIAQSDSANSYQLEVLLWSGIMNRKGTVNFHHVNTKRKGIKLQN